MRRLTTNKGLHREPVTYWVIMGDRVVRTDFERQMVRLRLGLTGQIPSRVVFRVSSIDQDAAHAFKVQQQFVATMMAAVPPDVRRRLSGLKPAGAT